MEYNQVGESNEGYPTQPNIHQLVKQQQLQLHTFWNYQRQEMVQASDFKNHQLPLARIKKIMKADEDVRMISAEAPILFAKACELFILELTIRSWLHSEENKRRTLQKNDIAAAITRSDIFDFLVDIVPREEIVKEEAGISAHFVPAQVAEGGDAVTADGVPYYYPAMGAAGMYVAQTAGVAWWAEDVSETQPQYGSGHGHAVDGGGQGYVATVQPPSPPS